MLIPAVLAVVLALPSNALAAPLLTVKLQDRSVRYGAKHDVTGTLVDGTTALANQEVVLEGQRYPYEGSYRVIERAKTGADGTFEFTPALDRNHRLRVVASAQGLTSDVLQAYTLPAFTLSFRAVTPGVVRLYQRYTVPTKVKLTAATLFYLGSKKATRASIRRSGALRRTSAGHYTSIVTVTLPASWHGAFRYASCFHASPGSGMGDPLQSCPHLRLKF